MRISRRTANAIAFALCLLFVAVATLWISRIGIQTDEALFAAGVYPPFTRSWNVRAFGVEFPLMVMTYVGTVKSVLYRALVFPFFPPSAASVRLPAVLIGAVSVWLFFRLTGRVAGVRAALAGTALLATDALYLLTVRWDWGPVAIQHLCLVAGLLAFVLHAQEGRRRWLAAGSFLFGIGLWDKALFSWWIAALGLATLLLVPRYARVLLRPPNAAIAVVAFAVGALPLLIYNVRHQWPTFRTNAEWTPEPLSGKARLVLETLNGSALFGGIMRDEWDGPVREPSTWGERAVVAVSTAAGMPRQTGGALLLGAALLCLPFSGGARRPALFALVAAALVWIQMALVKNGGTGAHHTILLWPAPAFISALALASVTRRLGRAGTPVLTVVVLACCASNLLVVGTYYTNMLRNGGTAAWTDALHPAAADIARANPSELCVVDWGFFDAIRLLNRGKTNLCVADDPVSDDAKKYAALQIADPAKIFISHTDGHEFNRGAANRLQAFAAERGYRTADHRIYKDFNGRPMVQTFRFEPR